MYHEIEHRKFGRFDIEGHANIGDYGAPALELHQDA